MQSDKDGESSIDDKNEDQEGCSYRRSFDENNEDQEGVMLQVRGWLSLHLPSLLVELSI